MDDPWLDEWQAQQPANGFSQRVVDAAVARRARRTFARRMGWAAGIGAVAVIAAAAVVLNVRVRAETGSGQLTASARGEAHIGNRATAVLEPGASIRWHGSTVEQAQGDVFYRVERGGPFVVKTPAGEVRVLGTCFRVQLGPTDRELHGGNMAWKRDAALVTVGAAAGITALVAVYEGKVLAASTREGSKVEIAAGQSARMDASGARAITTEGERAAAESALEGVDPGPYAEANDRLAQEMRGLNRRIRGLEQEKTELEHRLDQAKARLASADGSVGPERHEFDLSADDWAKLAEEGTIKFRVPCLRDTPWKPDRQKLDHLGLSPSDGDTLTQAYGRSNKRLGDTVLRLCAEVVGSMEVARSIGATSCEHVIVDAAQRRDEEGTRRAARELGLMRAGKMPMPAPGTPMHPVLEMGLALTGELKLFEADLASSFGPEEAHRIAYSDDLCASHSTYGSIARPK